MDHTAHLFVSPTASAPADIQKFKSILESDGPTMQINALKQIVAHELNGEKMPQLLMPIIRYALPSKNKTIKRLLLLYWEIIDRVDEKGALLPEMILVCNSLRNDLISPNEYVRGFTLRSLCRIREPELLTELVPTIITNLEAKHSYVRRNAVFCLYTVHKHNPHLCQDAPELVKQLLENETDIATKKNALIMLSNAAPDSAVSYLVSHINEVAGYGEVMQLAILDMIRRVHKQHVKEREKFIKIVLNFMNSTSPSVKFEAAQTLLLLTVIPTALRETARVYIDLLCAESDINIKMAALSKLEAMKEIHSDLMGDLLLDMLRGLTTPNLEIREKLLSLSIDLVSLRNVDELVMILKKEMSKTLTKDFEKASKYRHVLVQTIHKCALKYPTISGNVVHMLTDFLAESNATSALDVIAFIREVIDEYPNLRDGILEKLIQVFVGIKSSKIFRAALWLIGEYAIHSKTISQSVGVIKEALGPLHSAADRDASNSEDVGDLKPVISGNGYTAHLRKLILGGDHFLSTVLASTLTKLYLNGVGHITDPVKKNAFSAGILLIILALIRIGKEGEGSKKIDKSSLERLLFCVDTVVNPTEEKKNIWLVKNKETYDMFITKQKELAANQAGRSSENDVKAQVDAPLDLQVLYSDEKTEEDLLIDFASTPIDKNKTRSASRVHQLTGFDDRIYAEVVVTVSQYNILLNMLVMNKTSDTLQNLNLELATLGNLKLVERPQNYTLGPLASRQISANIKVSSTETGIVFGNLVYDVSGSSSEDRNIIVLADIHIDIMDYIEPNYCDDSSFRSLWFKFEWENKIAITTEGVVDIKEYFLELSRFLNMQILTSEFAMEGSCNFLSANLFASSSFDESALANCSIEKMRDGKINGYVRIRSNQQGIAVSLGDKVNEFLNLSKKPTGKEAKLRQS